MNTRYIITLLTLGVLSLLPLRATALEVYVEQPQDIVRAGDTVLVKMRVNTEGQEINAIEGSLTLNGPVKINSVSTGGSIFTFWPVRPSISKNTITFAGGSPSSMYGKDLNLFTLNLTLTAPGKVGLEPKDIVAYLGDGKGTALSGKKTSYVVNVGAQDPKNKTERNDLALMILTDKTPPMPFDIAIGQDPSLYEGKHFLTFFTEDAESGIDRYEVREGRLPAVRSGNTYVLQDQSMTHKVEVRAIDLAGNARVQVINLRPVASPFTRAIVLLIVAAMTAAFLKFYKKKP